MTIKCMGPDCTTQLLPETEEEALAQGWRQTDNYEVSPKLELVWICSDCVGRLISILTMKMQTAEDDTRRRHEQRTQILQGDYQRRLQDRQRSYADTMYRIHRSYGDALGQLKSPEAKRAEAALRGEEE